MPAWDSWQPEEVITMKVGDLVVARRDIGGAVRAFVPAGSRGYVVAAGWLSGVRVRFIVRSWSGRREVEIDVYPGEVEVVDGGQVTPRHSPAGCAS